MAADMQMMMGRCQPWLVSSHWPAAEFKLGLEQVDQSESVPILNPHSHNNTTIKTQNKLHIFLSHKLLMELEVERTPRVTESRPLKNQEIHS